MPTLLNNKKRNKNIFVYPNKKVTALIRNTYTTKTKRGDERSA